MSVVETQLTLRLSPQEIYRLDNFLFAKQETKQALSLFCQLEQLDFLFLAGEQGTGKTHLLIACAEAVQQKGHRVAYIAFSELIKTGSPDVLQAIEEADLICFDDIDAISGHKHWEEAVFHCFNRIHDKKRYLIASAQYTPSNIPIVLPDLCSRLATGLVYQLDTMNDDQKQQALKLQSASRGLRMSDEVAVYLLRHYGRDMPHLMDVLHSLDKASLEAKRKLTIPFIRQVLANA